MKRQFLPLLLLLAGFFLTTNTIQATIHTVLADNFFYAPDLLTISEGDTVEFVRVAGNHPTSSTSGDWTSPISGLPLNSGSPSFQLVFPDAGTYDYICDFHVGLGMVGTIIVEANCSASSVPDNFMASVSASAVTFSWDAVANSVGCRISGGPAGAGFPASRIIPGFEVGSAVVPTAGLAGGAYEALVQCACTTSPLLLTQQSAPASFTLPEARLSNEIELALAPNPATHLVNVQFSAETAYEVLVNDALGRTLQRLEGPAGTVSHQIELSDLANGTYFIQINAGDKQTVKQLNIQR